MMALMTAGGTLHNTHTDTHTLIHQQDPRNCDEKRLYDDHCDNVRFITPRTIIVLALRALFSEFTPEFDSKYSLATV